MADPGLREKGIEAVRRFCKRTGINLAGFDILFDRKRKPALPLFLEINYYFGRKGLGGSLHFYDLFGQAADRWLADGQSGPDRSFGVMGPTPGLFFMGG